MSLNGEIVLRMVRRATVVARVYGGIGENGTLLMARAVKMSSVDMEGRVF